VSSIAALQIVPPADGPALSTAKQRFNALVKQIERTRETLATWQDRVPAFRQAHAEAFAPIARTLDAGDRAWVFSLDAALARGTWSRTQRETLRELICELAGDLLHRHRDDSELKAVFDRHAAVDFDTARRHQEDTWDRIDEENVRAQDTPRPREAQAELAAASVRDVYRKLASALHPDRETDLAQRDTKTALMQRVNHAYDTKDLLTLLSLQLEIEQIDPDHVARADDQRVKHYNQVLTEQLVELRAEVEHLEWDFCDEFDVAPGIRPDPTDLAPILGDLQRAWDRELYQQKDRLRLLADEKVTQRWLNGERNRVRRNPFDPA